MSFDPDYASVSLLLHGDGANGSTTFTDSSSTPKTVTAYGNAQISTAQSKFGGASMAFDGSGDYLSLGATMPEWLRFGSVDFTIESWVYTTSTAPQALIGNLNDSDGTGHWWVILNSTFGGLHTIQFGVQGATFRFGSATLVINQWTHVAISRQGSALKCFVNGTQLGATQTIANFSGAFTVPAYIGVQHRPLGTPAYGYSLSGHLQDLRVTANVARYTANFTAPTAPFPETATELTAYARAAAPTPLGAPTALATYGNNYFARTATPGPLGTAATLAQLVQTAHTAAPGPLAAPSILAAALLAAYSKAPSPLGTPTALASMPLAAWSAAPSPLGTPTATAYHDFTGQLGDVITRYTMDLITPTGAVRVPVSSWQATLQTGSSNYVQCVIPACGAWADLINTATAFVIYRTAHPPGLPAIEYEMTRAPAEQVQFDQGPARYTCTLSGYTAGFAENEDPATTYDRVLTGVRSISTGTGGQRVRCAVDWLLRPGHRAFVRGDSFVVSYINYYSPSGFDSYMDVGSRA